MEKVGDQATHLKGEVIEGKDHLIELAEHAVASLKEKIHNMTATDTVAKKSVNPSAKKAAKKIKQQQKAIRKDGGEKNC